MNGQTVLVAPGPAKTGGINFTIDPLNTFDSGTFPDGSVILSLVSAPYSGMNTSPQSF